MNERLLLVCFVGTVGNKNHSKVQAKQKQSRLLWPNTRQLDALPQLHDHTEMKFSDYLAHLTYHRVEVTYILPPSADKGDKGGM